MISILSTKFMVIWVIKNYLNQFLKFNEKKVSNNFYHFIFPIYSFNIWFLNSYSNNSSLSTSTFFDIDFFLSTLGNIGRFFANSSALYLTVTYFGSLFGNLGLKCLCSTLTCKYKLLNYYMFCKFKHSIHFIFWSLPFFYWKCWS